MSTNTRTTMSLTSSEKAEWITQFNTKKSFPSKQVPCSCCNNGTTMFGNNLRDRVGRYESVEDFLNNFVCRTCKGKKRRGETIESSTPTNQEVEESTDETTEEIVSFDDSEGYVVEEPADETDDQNFTEDSEAVEETITSEDDVEREVEEETVFDDSEEHEDDSTPPVDVQALREKYKAFYAMKSN